YDIVPYQSTHNTGGTVMGSDPKTSASNRYLQASDAHNLFIMGASTFPQQPAYNPTGPVGALAYWSAEAITKKYPRNAGREGLACLMAASPMPQISTTSSPGGRPGESCQPARFRLSGSDRGASI